MTNKKAGRVYVAMPTVVYGTSIDTKLALFAQEEYSEILMSSSTSLQDEYARWLNSQPDLDPEKMEFFTSKVKGCDYLFFLAFPNSVGEKVWNKDDSGRLARLSKGVYEEVETALKQGLLVYEIVMDEDWREPVGSKPVSAQDLVDYNKLDEQWSAILGNMLKSWMKMRDAA